MAQAAIASDQAAAETALVHQSRTATSASAHGGYGDRMTISDEICPSVILNAGVLPNRQVLNDCPDQISRDTFEQRERSLLHVAATRARKRLLVTFCGEPSPFLQPA